MARFKSFAELAKSMLLASADVDEEAKGIIEFYTTQIEREAIAAAPGAGEKIHVQGGLTSQSNIKPYKGWTPIDQAIGFTMSKDGYKGTVYVEKAAGELAAWVEFGTGQSAKSYLASVPPEWRSLAQLYYINGRGTIIAQPYLLPAFLKNQILARKELTALLKNIRLK